MKELNVNDSQIKNYILFKDIFHMNVSFRIDLSVFLKFRAVKVQIFYTFYSGPFSKHFFI